ncbi:hypothetical protein IH979_01605 [Patescibacteria group bacterium]|nr:hypothetical protein [Patescibacteria group bacterium]
MFNIKAFANSIAVTTAIFLIALYAIAITVPAGFDYIFNAQFLGADVSSLMPDLDLAAFIGVLITAVITAWLAGYIWACLYNKFQAKKK